MPQIISIREARQSLRLMNNTNVIVFCLKCGGNYKRNETYPVKITASEPQPPAKLYICKGCYEALPVTDEVKRLEVVK